MASALAALRVALLGVFCATHALEVGRCVSPLGMESKAIPDSAISASSAYDSSIVGPQHGRLRIDKNGGAWCPRHMVTRDSLEWLEVDLRQLHVISAVQTQGRFGNGQGQEYAEVYMIDYWRPGSTKWIRWRSRSGDEMLEGNVNTFTVVERRLDPPLIASKIRFVPYSFHMRTVCMRIELLGCSWQEGIVTYSMPQGASRGAEVDLSDRTYDGREDGGHLNSGLGQLIDGQRGQDNFRMDFNGNGKGYEWIGWRNDSSGMGGRPVEIVFEFDRVRNFSAMYLHTNNLFSKDVQVFSQAKVYFSKGGHQFLGEPVYFTYMPDLIMEFARNVTIKLHNRIGRFIRLQLYFAQKWIMISEISFDSVIVSGNITDEEVDATLVKTSSASAASATGKEDTLQRDAAPGLTKGLDDRHRLSSSSRESGSGGGSGSSGLATESDRSASDSATSAAAAAYVTRSFAGLIIGVLTAVILLLTAAIFFIVLRIRRRGPNHIIGGGDNLPSNGITGTGMPLTLSTSEKPVSSNLKVSLDSEAVSLDSMAKPPPPVVSTPSAVYHEPYPPGTISGGYLHPGQSHLQTLSSPDYTDVQEMLPQEYAIPQGISGTPPPPFCSPPPNNGVVTTPGSGRPSIQLLYPASTISATTTNINLISNPPPVPPPPEKYYAATEICAPPLPPPPAAPLVLPLLADLAARSTSEEDSDDFEDDALKAVNLPTFPRERLRILKLLGYGKFGEVHLCSVEGTPGTPVDSENCIVSVKTLEVGAGEQTRSAFERSARVAGLLRDSNLAGVLGACLSDEPRCIVFEYGCWGDLNQFLQNRVAESAAAAAAATLPCSARTLSYGCLIYMATQIASGMKYLESINYIHKDLATRNCLVGREYSIKVSDLGIGASLYPPDYYKLDSRPSLPIRWMAWESILLGKMSSKSDVWSFAVTLWEILTFAREQPFDELADEGVVENASRFFQDLPIRILLPCPINCPKEIYDLMCECWQRNESDRPHFREIHLFLQRKNLGYVPSMD